MGSKYRGTKSELRALNAYIALMRAAGSVTERVHRSVAEHGVTLGQYAVLDALHYCGPLRMNELAAKVLTTGANITMIVDNLSKRALLTRSREEHDRRCVTITLTPAGQNFFAAIAPAHVSTIHQELSVLTAREQSELRRLCKKLGLGEGE